MAYFLDTVIPDNAVFLFFLKAEQFGLFGTMTPVKGYVNKKTGKPVAPYTGLRRRKLSHPISGNLFGHAADEVASSHIQPEPVKAKKPRKPAALSPEKLDAFKAKIAHVVAHAKVDAQHAPKQGEVYKKLYLAKLESIKGIPAELLDEAKQNVEGLFKPKTLTAEPPQGKQEKKAVAPNVGNPKSNGIIDPSHPDHFGKWTLHDYEERKKPEDYIDSHGNERTRMIGDWDNSETSHGSGKKIVNIYHLQHKDTGKIETFGQDTAYLAMGLRDKDTAKKQAEKILMDKKSANIRAKNILARVDSVSADSKGGAYFSLDERNKNNARGETPSLNWDTVALTKNGKWYVTIKNSQEEISVLKNNGWIETGIKQQAEPPAQLTSESKAAPIGGNVSSAKREKEKLEKENQNIAQKKRGRHAKVKMESELKQEKKEYRYAMTNRPLSIGAVPEGNGKKEPWEMTKKEFGYGGVNDWPLKITSKGKVYGQAALSIWAAENPNHRGPLGYYRTPETAQKWVDKTHRRLTKEAIRAGKPVPPEVLADYPDLKDIKPKAKAAAIEPPKGSGNGGGNGNGGSGDKPPRRFKVTAERKGKEVKFTVEDAFFDWLQVKPYAIWADIDRLHLKHPDHFASAEAVQQHIQDVLAGAEIAMPATHVEYTLLVALRDHEDHQAATIEFVLRGGKYRVRNAQKMPQTQLDVKLDRAGVEARLRRGKRNPTVPPRNPTTPGISAGSPVPPSDGPPTKPEFTLPPPAPQSKAAPAQPTSDTRDPDAEFLQTERAYGGRAAYKRALDAGKTKLNYRQWVQVRTPAFKQWFGDWEIASAQPHRAAATFAEARKQAGAFQGMPLTNAATGIVATVSRNNLDKMLSGKAVGKSESPATHSLAVANLDGLFERAILGWSKPDNNGDPNIKAIHRFFTPVKVDGRALLAKMTVKETGLVGDPNPLYTVEAVEFSEAGRPAAQWVAEIAGADGIDPRTIRSAGLVQSMAQRIQDFIPDSVSKVTDPDTGEPLVVYHGTNADFAEFKKEHQRPGQYGGQGFFFTANPDAAGLFGDVVMPVFLQAKTGIMEKRRARSRGEELQVDHIRPKDDARDIWVVMDSSQIKSALGNRGRFDAKSPDITKSWPFPKGARFLFYRAAS